MKCNVKYHRAAGVNSHLHQIARNLEAALRLLGPADETRLTPSV